ncbi:MAG: hypothetical protein JRI23_21530 [Deltaproteobacteria bacterium]|jgi:hypothetical protein|nr:hypothetical protein [Deltaproteobacteria bacterium]MBW2534524.1 hypothetical protein [Deltaproteobacteria bacterium]
MDKVARSGIVAIVAAVLGALGCSPEPDGLAVAPPARTTVKFDFMHEPLPEIPLPNDVATRYDACSATSRRINASMVAPTRYESRLRRLIDRLDGWGLYQPITIPFTGPLHIQTILDRHRDPTYELDDDVLYLVNIDQSSPHFGKVHHLDLGNGSYPVVLTDRERYGPYDPRRDSMSLPFEEVSEDVNRNGVLDPGEDANGNGALDPGEDLDGDGQLDPPEDTDADGILDVANYLPGAQPDPTDLAGRTDALMTFYERTTHTLIARPMVPLDERTTYAVVVTRRLLDAGGQPVGSPFQFVNHTSQTDALQPLLEVLPAGLEPQEIAFAFSFTTQTVQGDWKAVRDGLYGHGPQAHLAADYPPDVASLEKMQDADRADDHLLYGERWAAMLEWLLPEFDGRKPGAVLDTVVEGNRYVDYYVIGRFESPQLFARADEAGQPLPLNLQSWPPDLDRVAAPARSESVYFTLAVPRKEVSVRSDGQPAPLVILGHGYGTNRFDLMRFGSFFARHGLAVIAIDGPSHGLSLEPLQEAMAKGGLLQHGLGAAARAILRDRAVDLTADGVNDSGADFWTARLFHTRDVVRQFALDYMQLIRLVRQFDGQRSWVHDVDGDGSGDLAGDFDGDGIIDVGGDAPLYAFGGSLGGIMSMVLGSIEPEVDAVVPMSGGGGYTDIGVRTIQRGAYEGFIIASMAPVFHGHVDEETGEFVIETLVVDYAADHTFPVARLDGVRPWDTVLVTNLRNGVRRCGYVSPAGTVRVGIESDRGDPVRIEVYSGPQLDPQSTECSLLRRVIPIHTVDRFAEAFDFGGEAFESGSPLVALCDGLGLRRSHPDFRRFLGLGQLVTDPADPAVLARHMLREPLVYPGTGQQTGTHALIVTATGDMSVPVASAMSVARAAGIIDYLEPDARFGVPVNQLLIDTHVAEGVANLGRYVDDDGVPVVLDVEDFSRGTDRYGVSQPRFDQPPRIGFGAIDRLGGRSAIIFPFMRPSGKHDAELPGAQIDQVRSQCRDQCTAEGDGDPCGCDGLTTFDSGLFMYHMMAHYLATGGTVLTADHCMSRNDCGYLPPVPETRDLDSPP